MSKSYLEKIALAMIEEAGLPMPEREVKFCEHRKFRFDFCWPDIKLALEVDGGVFMKVSGHTSGVGVTANIEKMNEATLAGYQVIRATKAHMISGQMIEWLKRAMGVIE
jgi:hypothetical protein